MGFEVERFFCEIQVALLAGDFVRWNSDVRPQVTCADFHSKKRIPVDVILLKSGLGFESDNRMENGLSNTHMTNDVSLVQLLQNSCFVIPKL